MKKIYLLFIVSFTVFSLFAQAPQAFKYQAIARDDAGNILTNSPVGIKVSMLKGGTDGTLVYAETQQVESNSFGMINLVIGKGTASTGVFPEINWGADSYYIKIEVDISGGTNYKEMGTTQLYAVPYALYAEQAGSILGNVHKSSAVNNQSSYKRTPGTRSGPPNSKISADGDSFFNTITGNAGIGTTTPQAKLDVAGDMIVSDGLSVTGGNIMLKPAGTGGTAGQFLQTDGLGNVSWATVSGGLSGDQIGEGDSKVEVVDAGTGYVTFEIDATEKMRLTDKTLEFINNDSSVYIGYQAGNSISGNELGKNVFAGFLSGHNTTGTGYEGSYNTFVGMKSGYTNTTGYYNVFVGEKAGYENIEGYENVCIGAWAGYSNTGDYNVFIGSEAGSDNLDAEDNVFVGAWAGESNTTGESNTFIGSEAGMNNESGDENVFVGWEAGVDNDVGYSNVFVGSYAGQANTDGYENVFIGYDAGYKNDGGNENVYIGFDAGYYSVDATDNVFVGYYAGESNEGGSENVFIGAYAGDENTYGSYNVFIGYDAGQENEIGEDNVFIGWEAGLTNENGSRNVFIGDEAGTYSVGGTDNVFVGQDAGYNNEDGFQNIYIGSGAGADNTDGEGNIFIGYQAGNNEPGSDKLYIANSDTDEPLIHGDFATEKVTLNDVLILTPRDVAPASPTEGELYVNKTDHHIYCFLDGQWKPLD